MHNHQDVNSGDPNFTKLLFTPEGMALLWDVNQELIENKSPDSVEEVYYKIIETCKGYNQGTTLLALAEVMVALISTNAVKRKTDIQQVTSEP